MRGILNVFSIMIIYKLYNIFTYCYKQKNGRQFLEFIRRVYYSYIAQVSKKYSWYLITHIIHKPVIPNKKTWCYFIRLTKLVKNDLRRVVTGIFRPTLNNLLSTVLCNIICITPFRHSIRRLFLLHQSCHADARLPVQYHYIYTVQLCFLQQVHRSDVL